MSFDENSGYYYATDSSYNELFFNPCRQLDFNTESYVAIDDSNINGVTTGWPD